VKKLVCTVGIGRYEKVTYVFNGREKRTMFAPVAVGCCIAPDEELGLIPLLTKEAKDTHGEELRGEVEELGWTYAPASIPAGRFEGELWEIFGAFGENLRSGDTILLDLTHGLRHIPALLLSAAQYYATREGLTLDGVFYGAYDAPREDGKRPIFDLTPLVELPEWSYGVRLLGDYRLPGPLGRMLDNIQRRSHQRGQHRFTKLQKVGRPLGELEAPLVSGLPLEAGLEASKTLNSAHLAEEELDSLPPMRGLWEELRAQLQDFSLGESRKEEVALTPEELCRQARLVKGYLEVSNLRAAATVMRELVVSAVILHSGDKDRWLELEERRRAERGLGVLGRFEAGRLPGLREALSGEQRELAGLWNRITDRRNALAHAGMRRANVDFGAGTLRELWEKITPELANPDFWRTGLGCAGSERWLISPLGTSPGALYSAILNTAPDRLLVLTSVEGGELVHEVLKRSGREDLTTFRLILQDPFNGFKEVGQKVRDALSGHALSWISSREVVVNRTGGTTCLGWAAERLEAALRGELGLHPRTIACVDRRSIREQREEPYVEGEVIDMTDEGEGW
jgi:CRISPR-associated DxTHG motif protein